MGWKLAEAKNKFSELINKALQEGPQRVRRRKDTVFEELFFWALKVDVYQ